MILRLVTDKRLSETYESLDKMGIGYLLDLSERLDIMDFVEEKQYEEMESKHK